MFRKECGFDSLHGHHFNAVVAAPAFEGLSRIAQHRLVYDVFGSEVGDRIHALSIQTQASESESRP